VRKYPIVDGAVAWEPGAVDVAADGVLPSGRRRRKPCPPANKPRDYNRREALYGRASSPALFPVQHIKTCTSICAKETRIFAFHKTPTRVPTGWGWCGKNPGNPSNL
jgi:hypothetical protein